jgi:holo-[acyl-carrier protein] synthase
LAHRADDVTVGVGVDVVDLDRFHSVITRQAGFIDRVFTPNEREYCDRAKSPQVRCQRYAARFAAKECVMKALACGIGGFGFHEVEVARDEDSGEPTLKVTGKAAVLADERGVTRWSLSLSHSDVVAIAFVVAD